MKLSIGTLHTLLIALNTVDADKDTKLAGETRLAFAIDINLITPHAQAYEKTRGAEYLKIAKTAPSPDTAADVARRDQEFNTVNNALRDAEIDLDLKRVEKSALRLDDNSRLTAQLIAALSPVIIDFDK